MLSCFCLALVRSEQHLHELLRTFDLDVLADTARLVLRQAQRTSGQRKSSSGLSQDVLVALAQPWRSATEERVSFSQFVVGGDTGKVESGLYYTVYSVVEEGADKYAKEDKEKAGKGKDVVKEQEKRNDQESGAPQRSPDTPQGKGRTSSKGRVEVTPGKRRPSAPKVGGSNNTSGSAEDVVAGDHSKHAALGVTHISISDVTALGSTPKEAFDYVVATHKVPEDQQFEVAHRIKCAFYAKTHEGRIQLTIVRLLALAILAHTSSDELFQSKILNREPQLVPGIAELVQNHGSFPQEITTAALYLVDGIARLRNRLQEVLGAVNATSAFGISMVLLRKVLDHARNSETHTESDAEFAEALLDFLSYIIATPAGTNVLSSCGLIPTLTAALDIYSEKQTKMVGRIVGIIDVVISGFPDTYFDSFVAAHGLDLCVARIKTEVDGAIANAKREAGGDIMDVAPPVVESVAAASAINPFSLPIPNEKSTLIRSLLKLVLHIQQISGNADRVRNMIESTIPLSVRDIFAYSKTFGPSVFGLAANVMSAFIHNEPTSLQILQELKLPQTFLLSIAEHVPSSAEVVSAIPTAFGA
ncbi:DUF913-domain-containing protein, partial [Gonapodya prolifera JEL478]